MGFSLETSFFFISLTSSLRERDEEEGSFQREAHVRDRAGEQEAVRATHARAQARGEGARRALREVREHHLRRTAEEWLQEHPPRAQAAGHQREPREEGSTALRSPRRRKPRPQHAG